METAYTTPTEKVAETTLAYYRQGEILARNATETELLIWFSSCSAEAKGALALLGPNNWRTLASLRRYLLEKRGFSMQAYMLAHLASDELRYWVEEDVPDVFIG